MEDAVVQRLGKEGADDVVGQGLAVQARLLQRGGLGKRQAGRPGQGEDAPADAVPDHLGRVHIAVQGHHLGQLAGARRFEAQVELQLQRPGHGGGQRPRLQPPGGDPEPCGHARRQGQGVDIPAHPPLHAGAQHLHRDLAAIQEDGRMGLGEGGGGHRRLHPRIEALGRPAQAARDLGEGDLEGKRIELVLQSPEVLGEGAAKDVRAGGKHLAQLDRDRAQSLQRAGHAFPRPADPRPPAGEQAHQPCEQAHAPGQDRVQLAGNEGVLARQHPGGAHQTAEGAQIAHAQAFRAPIRDAAPPPPR